MARLACRIIRNYIDNQVLLAIIDNLMRLPRLENKRIARFDRCSSILMADAAVAGNHMIKFPLRAMGVVRTRRFARRNAGYFHIKWMPLV